jgi:membrane protein implicated in regulation of membrane protease activity
MWVVSIAWTFVVVVFAIAHALAPGGTLLGALLALVLGLAPLAVVLCIALAAARRRRTRHASTTDPDRSGHAPGDTVAAKREEP